MNYAEQLQPRNPAAPPIPARSIAQMVQGLHEINGALYPLINRLRAIADGMDGGDRPVQDRGRDAGGNPPAGALPYLVGSLEHLERQTIENHAEIAAILARIETALVGHPMKDNAR